VTHRAVWPRRAVEVPPEIGRWSPERWRSLVCGVHGPTWEPMDGTGWASRRGKMENYGKILEKTSIHIWIWHVQVTYQWARGSLSRRRSESYQPLNTWNDQWRNLAVNKIELHRYIAEVELGDDQPKTPIKIHLLRKHFRTFLESNPKSNIPRHIDATTQNQPTKSSNYINLPAILLPSHSGAWG